MKMGFGRKLKTSAKKKKIDIWGIEMEPGIHAAQSFSKGNVPPSKRGEAESGLCYRDSLQLNQKRNSLKVSVKTS
jgi:hypothetical protein